MIETYINIGLSFFLIGIFWLGWFFNHHESKRLGRAFDCLQRREKDTRRSYGKLQNVLRYHIIFSRKWFFLATYYRGDAYHERVDQLLRDEYEWIQYLDNEYIQLTGEYVEMPAVEKINYNAFRLKEEEILSKQTPSKFFI